MEVVENIRLLKRSKFAELSEILRNLEKIPNTSEMRQAATKQNKEELLHDLRGLLTAAQRERLDEIAHYCEIAFYGLDVALADGNVGRELGITENQRTSVRDRTNRLMRESEAALVELRRATHEKVLALLPDDQKSKAIELLGDFFDFHYGEWQRYRDVLADLEIVAKQSGVTIAEAGKNRNIGTSFEFGSKSLRELLYYLSNSAIRSQLELSREQVKLIRKLIDDSQSVDEKVSSVEYLTNAVDEVLNRDNRRGCGRSDSSSRLEAADTARCSRKAV